MEQFVGVKYRLKSSDNFENYLIFIEIGFFLRKTALAVSPDCVLTKEGDVYTITMVTSFRTVKTSFRLGEEFNEERADGAVVKSLFTLEGNTLIQTQIEANGRKSKHVREFTPNTLTVTSTADGWNGKCTRIYERVA